MSGRPIILLTVVALFSMTMGTAFADGDPEKGKRVFRKCKSCHFLDKKTNTIGPHLVGIIGRKAGTADKFKYSKAMKNSGIVWDEKSLDAYLQQPRGFIPGNKMTFAGLKKESQRRDVIAYIKAMTGGK